MANCISKMVVDESPLDPEMDKSLSGVASAHSILFVLVISVPILTCNPMTVQQELDLYWITPDTYFISENWMYIFTIILYIFLL